MRLDQYIASNFGFSRNRAQFFIDEKLVKVNDKIVTKTALKIEENDKVEIIEDKRVEFVARSAIKLEEFLKEVEIDISWKVCLDVGASTWWFTQVLLNKWVSQVVAVDVWSSQLHEKIKNDKRVISLENTDIRELRINNWELIIENNSKILTLNSKFSLIVVDVSFISLIKILDSLIWLSNADTKIILLFKPQFEVGRINLRKTWVPKDDKIVIASLDKFKFECKNIGFKIIKISESKLRGEAGNKEFFILMNLND